MLKRIDVNLLKPGMYIHDLNCAWLDHPFLTNSFAVRNDDTVERIRGIGIREVYIDTDRGDDVPSGKLMADINADIESRLQEIIRQTPERPIVVDLMDEKVRALRLHEEANNAMRNMMEGSRFGVHIDVDSIVPTVEGIIDSIFRHQDALLPLAHLKKPDDYTFHHSVSVCALLVAFGRSMKLPKEAIRDLALGGILHDIGNTSIPESLINKPGKLSEGEFIAMKEHVNEGVKLVSGLNALSPIVMEVITQHHERLDGSGYPSGKAGKEISLYGQMAGIVDVYDAITSNRPYHRGMSPTQALKKLLEWSDHHFDPQLVHSFIRAIGIYPSGTLVRLESNRMGIVLEQNTGKLLEPVVKVFYHAGRQHYIPPEEVDLSKGGDRVDSVERFEKWNIDPVQWLQI